MEKDITNKLGTESVGKLLLNLALPAIIAQLVNMLYNIVDRIYIGHIPEIGATALTGVGVTFPIIMVITAFSSLIGMGGAPRAAIKMGEKRNDLAEEILGNCFTLLIGISIPIFFKNKVFAVFFAEPIADIVAVSITVIVFTIQFKNLLIENN